MNLRALHFTPPSPQFWTLHGLGFIVLLGITRCFDFYYTQSFEVPLKHSATLFLSLTLIVLAYRMLFWQLKWWCRSTFHLLPKILLGSWVLAGIIQLITHSANLPIIVTALTDARAEEWRSDAMRTFTGDWAYYFYMIFAWITLYSAITTDRNHTVRASPEFDISNPTTRLTVLCSALPIVTISIFSARCWADLQLAIPSLAIASVIFVAALFFIAQCSIFIRFDTTVFRSRLLAQLPLLLGLIPALAVIIATVNNAISSIVIMFVQPLLLEEAQTMSSTPDISNTASNTYDLVNSRAGMHLGWLNQQLNLISVVALITFVAHYFHSASKRSSQETAVPMSTLFSWKSISQSTAPSFWLYNLAGWSIVAFYFSLVQVWEIGKISTGLNVFITIASVFSGLLYSPYMRQILKSYSFFDTNPIIFVIKLFLVCLAVGLASACVLNSCAWLYVFARADDVKFLEFSAIATKEFFFFGYWAFYIGAYFLWCLFYSINVVYRNKKHADIQALKMEAELKEAQLNTLSGQLDPHFIFNAINNIRALVKEDSERARDALVTLSEILRSSVYKKSQTKTRVSDELLFVHNYISLAQIQHEERLNFSEEVQPDAMAAYIPPMVLQMLVENAIKHGISQLPDGGDLALNIQVVNRQLICRVANSGSIQLEHSVDGLGVGVANIQARIKLLYGKNGRFELTLQPRQTNKDIPSEQEQWVVATLTIPYETHLPSAQP